jgi:hypothetical protein
VLQDIKCKLTEAQKRAAPLDLKQTHLLFREGKIETMKLQKLEPLVHTINGYNTTIHPVTVNSPKIETG